MYNMLYEAGVCGEGWAHVFHGVGVQEQEDRQKTREKAIKK